jgi:hypothetical protein
MVRHYAGFETGLWYIQEVTEGVTPTTSPSFLHLAHKATLSYSSQGTPNAVEKSGDRDFTGFKKGVETYVATVSFKPSTASGQAFIKNFIDTDNSFTLLSMIDEASDVIFARFAGCKIKRISPTVQLYPTAGELEVTAEIWAMSVVYSNVDLTTPSFESAPSTFVNWSDVTVKKATVTLTNWWEFGFTMEQDLFRIPTNTGTISGIGRGRRRVNGNITISSNATSGVGDTELGEQKDATAILFNFLIGVDDYAFTASALTNAEVDHPLTDLIAIKSDFQASTFAVS